MPPALEGQRVGVNRGYTVTTGVWARGILADQYGVDLSRVTWVPSGDEHVAEFRPPSNVVPIEKGKKMADMLASGELPAAIGVDVDHPDVKPLIAELKARVVEELDYSLEADAQRGFAAAFVDDPQIVVPRVVASAPKVIVSEWL